MLFPQPLTPAILLRRYKRFLADVRLADGTAATAHVPNPGAMLGLDAPGSSCWLSLSPSRTRKLPMTLELIEAEGGLVGVNTLTPNRLVAEALAERRLPAFAAYAEIRPEVRYGEASRVDFRLAGPDRPPLWLEVKNVHLSRTPGLAEFPDCKAARSARHLRDLASRVAAGDRAAVLFVVQRMDCRAFAPAGDIDPVFTQALQEAAEAGVEVHVHACEVATTGVTLGDALPWSRA